MQQTAALSLVMAALASAVSAIFVKDLPNECETFPGAKLGNGSCEGNFQIYAEGTGKPEVDGKHAMQWTSPVSEAWGSIAIVTDQLTAWPKFKVVSSQGYTGIQTQAQNPNSFEAEWADLKLSADADNQQLLYNYIAAGYLPKPYALYLDAEGAQKVAGVFLGANGQVTWAFSMSNDQKDRDKYIVRLLNDEKAPLRDEEFTGYLRVKENYVGVNI